MTKLQQQVADLQRLKRLHQDKATHFLNLFNSELAYCNTELVTVRGQVLKFQLNTGQVGAYADATKEFLQRIAEYHVSEMHAADLWIMNLYKQFPELAPAGDCKAGQCGDPGNGSDNLHGQG